MRITKRGTPLSEVIWAGRCRQCDSEAEASELEMTHITHDQREAGNFSWEKCPVCKAGDNATGFGGMLFYPKNGT